jgi:hypothetical protein
VGFVDIVVSGSDGAYLEVIPRSKAGIIAAFTRRLGAFLIGLMVSRAHPLNMLGNFERDWRILSYLHATVQKAVVYLCN